MGGERERIREEDSSTRPNERGRRASHLPLSTHEKKAFLHPHTSFAGKGLCCYSLILWDSGTRNLTLSSSSLSLSLLTWHMQPLSPPPLPPPLIIAILKLELDHHHHSISLPFSKLPKPEPNLIDSRLGPNQTINLPYFLPPLPLMLVCVCVCCIPPSSSIVLIPSLLPSPPRILGTPPLQPLSLSASHTSPSPPTWLPPSPGLSPSTASKG